MAKIITPQKANDTISSATVSKNSINDSLNMSMSRIATLGVTSISRDTEDVSESGETSGNREQESQMKAQSPRTQTSSPEGVRKALEPKTKKQKSRKVSRNVLENKDERATQPVVTVEGGGIQRLIDGSLG